MHINELNEELGNMDLYLLDQVLKGRFESVNRILDAGCGEGRNSQWFVRNGKDVYFADKDEMALKLVRMRFRTTPEDRFAMASLEQLPYPDEFFDACICSAVLHFAEGWDSFIRMWEELVRVLKKGGILFIRMSCTRGLTERGISSPFPYSLTEDDLEMIERQFSWEEPFKTVLVENRSMGMLMLRKL